MNPHYQFAPSEEFTLHCDVPGCDASLSMVAGVRRGEHGWGRVTLYEDAGFGKDLDLCQEHTTAVKAAISGTT